MIDPTGTSRSIQKSNVAHQQVSHDEASGGGGDWLALFLWGTYAYPCECKKTYSQVC